MKISRIVLLILSALTIGTCVSSQRYTIRQFIDDVSFIPGAKPVLTVAYKGYCLYNELKSLVPMNTTEVEKQLEEISDKLDYLDSELKEISSDVHELSNDVNELKSTIADKVEIDQPSQILLYSELKDLHKEIREVNRLFDRMQKLDQTVDEFEASTYEAFVKNILDPSHGQLSSALNAIHDAFTGENEMLDILVKKHLTNTLVCRDEISPLYRIQELYTNAMKAYMEAMILNYFAYDQQKKGLNKPDGFKGELNLLTKEFYTKTFDIVERAKYYMSRASAAYWKCDAVELHESVTYAKLGPIFQTYFLKEEDARDRTHECRSTCDERKDLVITDKCESGFCKNQTKCSGAIVDCQKSHYNMNICLAEPKSGRRYHYVEATNRENTVYEFFGKKNTCRKLLLANEKALLDIFLWKYHCEYCKCVCLSHDNIKDIDRYFSLKKVTSDVDNNKVVTGVRFFKKNHILHIQIEEGTLVKDGVIAKNSNVWKPVHNFSIDDKDVKLAVDYHSIEWHKRIVHLDDLASTGDRVLTGLRFKLTDDNALQLEIQLTPFDFDSGKLDVSKCEWITNKNEKQRSEIDMSERDLPRANTYRHLDSEDNQFLKFTTSSFKDDVGQTVVPYIDLGEVTTPVRTPLSGAGLVHQANTPKSAGFLSFKLFNYNYVHHLGNMIPHQEYTLLRN